MNRDEPMHPSHLFTVRVRPARLKDGQIEWRGHVEHVLTGERHYFRDWSTLIDALRAMLPDVKGDDVHAR